MQTELEVRRAAARLGSGHKGKRETPTHHERKEQADAIGELWNTLGISEQPAYLNSIAELTDWRDRPAKLFEIGEYKDKHLTVSEADLQNLAANFDLPVPILIEHTENPLQLGYLTDVKAAGRELFGTLTLTPEADELIKANDANSLSISVSKDFASIFEVSIVSNPRVESARLFCHSFNANTLLDERLHELESERLDSAIDTTIEKLIREGKLAPACKSVMRTLFQKANQHEFEAELKQMVDLLPPRATMSEIAPAKLDRPQGLTANEEQFYRMHFVGLDLFEIAKRKEEI